PPATRTLRHRCRATLSGSPFGEAKSPAARGESLASHRDGRGAPPARRDDREPGPPPRVFCAVGWQYREYLSEEQRSRRRGPQRGGRVGVAWGCIPRRMPPAFPNGRLALSSRLCLSLQPPSPWWVPLRRVGTPGPSVGG